MTLVRYYAASTLDGYIAESDDSIDWLTGYQAGKRWSWTELRPQTLCGFAPGTAMSIVPVIAVYAAICKELGLPLRFPGKPGAWRSIYQVTESAHMAGAALWAATTVVIRATRADIAQLAGSSRESVSRFLATLDRAGLVTCGRGKVVIHDPAALRRYIY